MDRLSVSLFGGFKILKGEQPITCFHYDKVRALLALLVVDATKTHRRDTLAGLLWPDAPETTARTNLRQALAILRRCMDDNQTQTPYLCVSRDSIRWNTAAEADVDVLTFTALLQACEGHAHRSAKDCQPCAQRRSAALRLYLGDLLHTFSLPDADTFEEWLLVNRENLRRQAIDASHELAEYHERRGDYALAEAIIRRDLVLEPWDEASHRQLMRLLYLSDQRSKALTQYETCRRVLKTELGVEPEAATTELFEQIRAEAVITANARGSLALPAARPHNLPPNITPFFGRETELAHIASLFNHAQARLIVLSGPGGIGKTRLALQAATEQLDNFMDGVFFVPLEGVSNGEEAVFAIAHTLGYNLSGAGEAQTMLVEHLASKSLLLVLDNYEHLLPETGLPLAIIGGAPRVSLLVTSRERLNIRGEQVIDVGGLSLTGSSVAGDVGEPAALAMFAACGARARADFRLKNGEREAAVEICRMLDGIPLAIELAAAWISVLSCRSLAEEIHHDVNILSDTLHGLPERQRSLRAIFDHSWASLSTEEAASLARLSVFRNGFDRNAAEQVAGGNLLLLKSLLDKSLIRRNFRQGYEMHELARQYAGERLEESGAAEAVRHKHLEYYTHRMETLTPQLDSKEALILLSQLEEDHDNLRAALDWALASGHLRTGLRLAIAANRLWTLHNHAIEAQRRMEALLSAVEQANGQSFREAGLTSEVAIPTGLLAKAHHRAGLFALQTADWERSQYRLEEALRLARLAEDQEEQAAILQSQGIYVYTRGDLAGARRILEDVLTLRRRLGQREMLANPLLTLGIIMQMQNDYVTAQAYIEESIAIYREMGHLNGEYRGLVVQAWWHLRQGNRTVAQHTFLRVMALFQQLGSREGIAFCLEGLGVISMTSEGKAVSGTRLYGAAMALRQSIGMPLMEPDRVEYTPFIEQGRRALGDEAWEQALDEGRHLELQDAIRLAKEEH